MVVDDSVVIRGLISRWIAAEPDMVVAASLRTGLEAVNQVERIMPDVAVLDIEMPELDGISALPKLLAKKRDLIVIMASTLTRRNAEISFKALSLGASDYIPKPETTREPQAAEIFHHDLIQKIRAFGAKVRRVSPARGFTAQATLERVHAAGMLARREPIADAELGELLASSAWAPTGDGPEEAQPRTAGIPARRYSDEELAAIAASPSRMLCECPRHLSEIISQLASFEEYSAACLNDSEEDARVHAHLRSVAGSARALFEGALQLVIAHERRQRPAG